MMSESPTVIILLYQPSSIIQKVIRLGLASIFDFSSNLKIEVHILSKFSAQKSLALVLNFSVQLPLFSVLDGKF